MTRAALIAIVAITSTAQAPPRDQTRGSSTGTASITGVVVENNAERSPLRRVTVYLSRTGNEDTRMLATDDTGRYMFGSLPAGTYTLNFAKGGYLGVEYGQSRPGVPGGRSITLAEGQVFAANRTILSRGGVIAGRIVDAQGRPVVSVPVIASQFVSVGGTRTAPRTAATRQAATNEHGDYRIFGLIPGEYVVRAEVPSSASLPATITAAELQWATARSSEPPPAPPRPTGYVATLFPGTTDPSSATAITLAPGEERLGIDITLQTVPVSRITGRVIGVNGNPVSGATVWRTPKRNTPFRGEQIVSVVSGSNGSFTFSQNAPGDFVLTARYSGTPTRVPQPDGSVRLAPSTEPTTAGTVDVSIAGQDVADLAIPLQPTLVVSGRIVSGGSRSGELRFQDLSPQLQLASTTPTPPRTTSAAVVLADGTFRIDGVMPGSYRMRVFGQAIPWVVRSAMHAGRDLVDVPIEIQPGANVTDVVISMTDALSQVSGSISEPTGQPVPDLNVLVFSTEKSYWIPNARRVKTVRASDNGTYLITDLPAGEYFLCAAVEIDRQLMFEPEYLQQLIPLSLKITLGESEKKTQNLRTGR